MTYENSTELVRAFQANEINPAGFGHLNHVRVAYELLSRADFFEAASDYATGIRRIVAKAGVPEKFNATITLAFMSLIAERMGTVTHVDCNDFVARNQDLLAKEALANLYSRERLQSDLARTRFLLPDTPTRRNAGGRQGAQSTEY